uniref:MBL fold metallo-hydrolase n=1 Tax=Fervidicoccus fontis TaxID=683846 RepID=A0A7J3ZJ79_9CREN
MLAEHGFSVLLEVTASGKTTSILVDAGFSGSVLLHNSSQLGIDLEQLNATVLSHGHVDHTGGLIKLLSGIQKQVPVIAHPRVEKPHY